MMKKLATLLVTAVFALSLFVGVSQAAQESKLADQSEFKKAEIAAMNAEQDAEEAESILRSVKEEFSKMQESDPNYAARKKFVEEQEARVSDLKRHASDKRKEYNDKIASNDLTKQDEANEEFEKLAQDEAVQADPEVNNLDDRIEEKNQALDNIILQLNNLQENAKDEERELRNTKASLESEIAKLEAKKLQAMKKAKAMADQAKLGNGDKQSANKSDKSDVSTGKQAQSSNKQSEQVSKKPQAGEKAEAEKKLEQLEAEAKQAETEAEKAKEAEEQATKDLAKAKENQIKAQKEYDDAEKATQKAKAELDKLEQEKVQTDAEIARKKQQCDEIEQKLIENRQKANKLGQEADSETSPEKKAEKAKEIAELMEKGKKLLEDKNKLTQEITDATETSRKKLEYAKGKWEEANINQRVKNANLEQIKASVANKQQTVTNKKEAAIKAEQAKKEAQKALQSAKSKQQGDNSGEPSQPNKPNKPAKKPEQKAADKNRLHEVKTEKTSEKLQEVKVLAAPKTAYKRGSNATITARFQAEPENLQKVMVDGKEIEPMYYSVKRGSTIIELKTSYLNKLKQGKHKLTATFLTAGEMKQGVVNFEIAATKRQVAKTGEVAQTSLALACFLLASGAMLAKHR